jgi:hypothetical protein
MLRSGRRIPIALALGIGICGLPGCAGLALPALPIGLGAGPEVGSLVTTTVELSDADHRVIEANAIGESRGLTLLLFFTVDPATYAEAFSDLSAKAPLEADCARAFANVVHERTARNFLLFSLPRVTVRADLVEFRGEGQGASCAGR